MLRKEGLGEFKGLLSVDHLIFSLSGVCLIIFLLYISRNIKKEKVSILIVINFFVLFILEILKIIWNFTVYENPHMKHWVPLYFCSLYIYATLFYTLGYFFKNNFLKKLGLTWICYGQIIAGLCFIIYPSSSIGINPLIHVMTFHSFIFHVLSAFTGLVIIRSKLLILEKNDLKIYGISTFIILLFIFIFNIIFDTNLAFLNKPFLLPPLESLYNIHPLVYIIFCFFGHIFILFFSSFYLYKLARLLKFV